MDPHMFDGLGRALVTAGIVIGLLMAGAAYLIGSCAKDHIHVEIH